MTSGNPKDSTPLLGDAPKKQSLSVTMQMALFLLMVVMSSIEPIISKWSVPETDAKKPFHLRPNRVSIEFWNYAILLFTSIVLIVVKLGSDKLKECFDFQNGMKHFLISEAFHGTSRVVKLLSLSAGASSSLMKVVTQCRLLLTAVLNKTVKRVVTLTQWMLILACTVLVFAYIKAGAEVDAARKDMALAQDDSGSLWRGNLPKSWAFDSSAVQQSFIVKNAIVLLCLLTVTLSTLSLFTGDLALKKNSYHFLIQMVQSRLIGLCVVFSLGVWSFLSDLNKTYDPNGSWLDEYGNKQTGNMAEVYNYAEMNKLLLFFRLVFCFKNWHFSMVINVAFQVCLAYTITYVLKMLDALWKGMGSALSVAGTFVIETLLLPLLYAGGSGAFDAMVKKDTLNPDRLKTFSVTELSVVMGIVFTVAAYGCTKLEAEQHKQELKKVKEELGKEEPKLPAV